MSRARAGATEVSLEAGEVVNSNSASVGVSQGCARLGGGDGEEERRRITRMAARAAVGWSWSAGGGSDEARAALQ
jgi:hypothetical protein